jgi:ABC-type transport system substrate-binding protein
MSSALLGRFDRLTHRLRGGSTVPDAYLHAPHMPGHPLNAGGVDDPKLTTMIRAQRQTFDAGKRREIVHDIQRHLAEQVYYQYGPSVSAVAAWAPYVKNFAPNIGHDYGGRLMVAWLDK